MRVFGFLSVIAAVTVAASGQDNVPEVRKLSLEDSIRLALEHNLEVQVRKFDPQLAQFTLGGTYGAYDPEFQASIQHSFNQSPGGIDAHTHMFNVPAPGMSRSMTNFIW